MITSLLPDAIDAELEDWGPLDEATGDPMATHGLEVWVDGESSAGIWQCAPVRPGGRCRPTRSSTSSRAG